MLIVAFSMFFAVLSTTPHTKSIIQKNLNGGTGKTIRLCSHTGQTDQVLPLYLISNSGGGSSLQFLIDRNEKNQPLEGANFFWCPGETAHPSFLLENGALDRNWSLSFGLPDLSRSTPTRFLSRHRVGMRFAP